MEQLIAFTLLVLVGVYINVFRVEVHDPDYIENRYKALALIKLGKKHNIKKGQ